jgi:hypothetical protein
MVTGYIATEEASKNWQEITGKPYPRSINDEQYEQWINDTTTENMSKYTRHKPVEIKQIRRLRTETGEEYLYFNAMEYRIDKATNLSHRWRPGQGRIAVPIPQWAIEYGDFGKERRYVKDILGVETKYVIPYEGPKSVDKILDLGMPLDGKVQYAVESHNGIRVGVSDRKGFAVGKWEELFHFSAIPNETQKRIWLESGGGLQADRERMEEARRRIDERDIPQKAPTIMEVKSMIDEAVKEKEVSKQEGQALQKVEVEGKPEEQAVQEIAGDKTKKGRPKKE